MKAFAKAFILALASSSASGESNRVNNTLSSSASFLTIVRVAPSIRIFYFPCAAQVSPSGDVNVLGSSSSSIVAKPTEGLFNVLNGVPVDVMGDEHELNVMNELLTTAGSRNSEDSNVVASVAFGGLRATAGSSICVGAGDGSDPYRPRPVRDGVRYRFNVQTNAECRDASNLSYEWGEFTK
jgi:hypothetical protein